MYNVCVHIHYTYIHTYTLYIHVYTYIHGLRVEYACSWASRTWRRGREWLLRCNRQVSARPWACREKTCIGPGSSRYVFIMYVYVCECMYVCVYNVVVCVHARWTQASSVQFSCLRIYVWTTYLPYMMCTWQDIFHRLHVKISQNTLAVQASIRLCTHARTWQHLKSAGEHMQDDLRTVVQEVVSECSEKMLEDFTAGNLVVHICVCLYI